MSDPAVADDLSPQEPGPWAPAPVAPGATPRRPRPVGWIVAVVVLSLGLAAVVGGGVWLFIQLSQAQSVIRDNERELREQRELIEKKESFGAAMNALLSEVAAYGDLPFPSVIAWDDYDSLTWQAWARRWDSEGMDESIAAVDRARAGLVAAREAAAAQAAENVTGSVYESTFDRLGGGFVGWSLDDADALCRKDVLACVSSDEPRTVHVDAADDVLPYMTDEIRIGVAYHEFAHVLQFANPEPTTSALEAFAGDAETMADCFALTYVDGWTLDHRVWVSNREYWDIDVGYGYACDEAQKQVIREWRESLGIQFRRLGPGAQDY